MCTYNRFMTARGVVRPMLEPIFKAKDDREIGAARDSSWHALAFSDAFGFSSCTHARTHCLKYQGVMPQTSSNSLSREKCVSLDLVLSRETRGRFVQLASFQFSG